MVTGHDVSTTSRSRVGPQAHQGSCTQILIKRSRSGLQQLKQLLRSYPFSLWADKGSKRNLWNEESVAKAIDYVLNIQGGDLPDFDD